MLSFFYMNNRKVFIQKYLPFDVVLWFLILLVVSFKFLILRFYLKNSSFETPDSEGYLVSAKNFWHTYLTSSPDFMELSLFRTPGYPLFLSILPNNTSVIYIQILLHACISILAILIVRRITGTVDRQLDIFVLIITQIETSLSVYSFRILTEILFAFLITLFSFLILRKLKDLNSNKLGFSIYFILLALMLVRPIGFAMSLTFLILFIISDHRKKYFKLFSFCALVYLLYSGYNYYRVGVFSYSTVQNEHLLLYQGAGAQAISQGRVLGDVQNEEKSLRDMKLEDLNDIAARDFYNGKRGTDLILSNKLSFVKLNFQGAIKVLYGPNKFEIRQLLSDENRVEISDLIDKLFFLIAILVTFLISSIALLSIFTQKSKNEFYKFVVALSFFLIIFGSGAGAYGRFRTPVAIFLCIFTALFFNKIRKHFTERKI